MTEKPFIDTRKQLEEDARRIVQSGYVSVNDVKAWFDRQATITRRECSSIDWWAKVESLQDERDELQSKLDAYGQTHMELPLDADGVPIKVGDKMQYHGGEPFIVCAVAPGVIHTWAAVKLGERKTTYDYAPIQCTHYKPRTIEDVLREFAERYLDYEGMPSAGRRGVSEALMDEYADELRELMEVEHVDA